MSQPKRMLVATTAGLLLLGGATAIVISGGFFTARPAAEAGQRTPFAAERAGPKDAKPVKFDGQRAMKYLQAICDIGPRMSGTPGMRKQQELIKKHFEVLGVTVKEQNFSARQVSRKNAVEMTNLIVSWHPERKRRVILCSHYDTRPIADQEPDPRKWRETFLSANDGGSGVAFLMELGNHMKDLKVNVGVDFVFFDGEEYIFEPKRDEYFFGSKHFASAWRRTNPRPEYAAAILLDMIGGKDARFPAEGNSFRRAKSLVQQVWGIAQELKSPMFLNEIGEQVLDDHMSLLGVGIPAIDIIDFQYPHWHRLTDTPANCSADSLTEVARVLTTWLQRTK